MDVGIGCWHCGSGRLAVRFGTPNPVRGPCAARTLTLTSRPPLPIAPCQVAARVEAAQGEGFLRAIKAEWEAHNKSVQMIRDILMYMDRIYVKQQACVDMIE